MPYVPFIGPSYVYRSIAFDCQRSINLYPAKSEVGDSKTPSLLMGRPGLDLFSTISATPNRGGHQCNGRAFVVCGSGFYELFANSTTVLRGTLLTSGGFVSIDNNGEQVCIVDGDNGYIFAMSTNTFTRITSSGWLGATTVTFMDGYFVFNKPDSEIYYISAAYDGLTIDPLDFASAEGSPDNIVGLIALHQNVWLLGQKSVQMVYDSGAADFPFAPVQGAFIEYGCASAASISRNSNTLFWLGNDDNGAGMVWMAQGYQPLRISTQAIEKRIQEFSDKLATASGFCYQEEGHYFYSLDIEGMDTTLVYDVTMQQWHERAYYNSSVGSYERHLPIFHIYAFGKHLVGDYRNGNIYEQNLNYYDDNGDIIRYQRTSPHEIDNLDRVFYESLQIDMQVGIGLDGSAPTEDATPIVALQYSNDGGNTWSDESYRNAGAIGRYLTRVLWKRLGSARDRVHRVTIACRAPIAILGCVIKARKGIN